MNQSYSVPPPELVQQWYKEWRDGSPIVLESYVATQAARWGADQELEACCQALYTSQELRDWLRAARRPKPPSLKEQALRDLDALAKDLERNGMGFGTAMIRRALEALDD